MGNKPWYKEWLVFKDRIFDAIVLLAATGATVLLWKVALYGIKWAFNG